MTGDPQRNDEPTPDAAPPRAEDLFMPAIDAVVKHMARMAAEADYGYFIRTGRVPYAESNGKEGLP